MEINGLRAILVGGASGMARATAERIVAGGGSVAILDREQSAGAEVAAELGGSWHPCDVLDFEGIEVVIAEAVDALGGLDAAVNTAGGGKAGAAPANLAIEIQRLARLSAAAPHRAFAETAPGQGQSQRQRAVMAHQVAADQRCPKSLQILPDPCHQLGKGRLRPVLRPGNRQ